MHTYVCQLHVLQALWASVATAEQNQGQAKQAFRLRYLTVNSPYDLSKYHCIDPMSHLELTLKHYFKDN